MLFPVFISRAMRSKSSKTFTGAFIALLTLASVTLGVASYTYLNSRTFAWFASNEKVEAKGMAISLAEEKKVDVKMEVYRYDLEQQAGVKVDPNEDGSYNLVMNTYDTIFDSLRQYNPLVIKLNISGKFSNLKALSFIRDSAMEGNGDSEKELSQYLSSVIQLNAKEESQITGFDGTDANTLWHSVRNYFAGETVKKNAQKYVTSTTAPFTKDTAIDMTKDYLGIADSASASNVYVCMDYNDELVRKFAIGVKGDIGSSNTYIMENDIVRLQCLYNE